MYQHIKIEFFLFFTLLFKMLIFQGIGTYAIYTKFTQNSFLYLKNIASCIKNDSFFLKKTQNIVKILFGLAIC